MAESEVIKILENKKYELFRGNCINVMDDLIHKGIKVNSVICDIPYGTTACSWDEIIPFEEMWDKFSRRRRTYYKVVIKSR